VSASQARRIEAMATTRGPLGVSQHDFDYPTRDRGPEILHIAKVIAAERLDLQLVHTADGPVWYRPEFAPTVLMRSGWGCFACGARHPADWPGPACGGCGRVGFLVQARVLAPKPKEAEAA
jgi:hypothetical protein